MARIVKKPKKRLALVVHGLGEQGPGETLDDLAGGLWGADDKLRVSSDIRLMQVVDQSDTRKLETFPCHVRRYSDPATPNDPHTTFAEVYWADISQADRGSFQIFYGLIKAILGLGHIVRAGVQQYFGKGDTWSSRFANFIPYLLHGPVAGVNVALAVGVLILFAATKLFAETENIAPEQVALGPGGIGWTLLIAGLFLCAVGYFLSRKSDVYYFRIFLVWTALCGALMAALAALQLFWVVDESVKSIVVKAFLGSGADVSNFSDGFLWIGLVLLLCLKVTWLVLILTLVILTFATVWRLLQRDKKSEEISSGERPIWQVPPLHLILPCAMLWLWMLVIATIWVVVYNTGTFKDQIHTELLNAGVRQLVTAMLGVGLVTLGVAVTLGIRSCWRRHFKEPLQNINKVFAKHPVPRLLLSRGIVSGLMLTGALFIASALLVVLEESGVSIGLNWLGRLDGYLPHVIAIAVVVGGAAYTQREGIAQALGVGKDLITYFKVEPTEHGFHPEMGEKMGVFSFPKNYEFNNFRQRRRIHGRMQKVLLAMCKSVSFDELIVISHSQGTIIATEFAKELQKKTGSLIKDEAREALAPEMKKATLVTMGSPFTHVYNYYLPSEFGGPETLVKGETVKDWINIFRVDDFIGTYVGKADLRGTWPRNEAVPPGGHTGYWKDAAVIKHLRPLFGLP